MRSERLGQFTDGHSVRLWLKIAVLSLGFAGVYSIVLVALRTPQLYHYFSNPSIFKSALVIHVNLSVLIWLLSITASVWSYNIRDTSISLVYAALALVGSILITISPLCATTEPVMNNYIPMLENIIFILGMTLFGIGILLFAVHVICVSCAECSNNSEDGNDNKDGKVLLNLAIISSAIMFVLTWICFTISYFELSKIIQLVPMDIELYYEMLFWSGGHLLQFIYTQILIIIWIILFVVWIGKNLQFTRLYAIILIANFIFSLAIVAGHFLYDVADGAFKPYYTEHVKYYGGIAPVLALSLLFYETYINRKVLRRSPIMVSIICSVLLFLFGGLIALKISDANVVIPAHYHGSVVGISIAFMGFAYFISDNRLTNKLFPWSIGILTIGQILHITGLALSGGYGVLRKTTAIEMHVSAKLFMGMMGVGGIIAIIGGLMFVIICGKTLFFKVKI